MNGTGTYAVQCSALCGTYRYLFNAGRKKVGIEPRINSSIQLSGTHYPVPGCKLLRHHTHHVQEGPGLLQPRLGREQPFHQVKEANNQLMLAARCRQVLAQVAAHRRSLVLRVGQLLQADRPHASRLPQAQPRVVTYLSTFSQELL